MDKKQADIAMANLVEASENALKYNKEDLKTIREYFRETIGDLFELAMELDERYILDLLFDDPLKLVSGLAAAYGGAKLDSKIEQA